MYDFCIAFFVCFTCVAALHIPDKSKVFIISVYKKFCKFLSTQWNPVIENLARLPVYNCHLNMSAKELSISSSFSEIIRCFSFNMTPNYVALSMWS